MEGLIERSIAAGKPSSHRVEWEAELTGEPFPPELLYLWRIHNRLRRRQGGNGWGPMPISWQAIDAFVRHAHQPLAPWEVEIIETLDDLYMTTHAKARQKAKSD